MFLSTCFQRLLLANLSIFVLQRYGNKLGPIILHSTEAIVRGCFVKKVLLKISQYSQQKKPSVPEPQATTLLKKRLWHRCFPVNSSKFQRTLFFHRTPPVAASGSKQSFRYVSDQLLRLPQLCWKDYLQECKVWITWKFN